MGRQVTLHCARDKTPPLRKSVVLWLLDGAGNLYDWKAEKLQVLIPATQEEYDAIPDDEHKFLAWSDGGHLSESDVWSERKLDKVRKEMVRNNKGYLLCPHCGQNVSTSYMHEEDLGSWHIGCSTKDCAGHIDYGDYYSIFEAEKDWEDYATREWRQQDDVPF